MYPTTQVRTEPARGVKTGSNSNTAPSQNPAHQSQADGSVDGSMSTGPCLLCGGRCEARVQPSADEASFRRGLKWLQGNDQLRRPHRSTAHQLAREAPEADDLRYVLEPALLCGASRIWCIAERQAQKALERDRCRREPGMSCLCKSTEHTAAVCGQVGDGMGRASSGGSQGLRIRKEKNSEDEETRREEKRRLEEASRRWYWLQERRRLS